MSTPDAAADAVPPPRPDADAAAMPPPPPIPTDSKTNPDLPIAGARADIVRLLREHDFLVVVGDTGSGKTTQLPAYLLEDDESRTDNDTFAPVAITRGESEPRPAMHATGSLLVSAMHDAIAPPQLRPAIPKSASGKARCAHASAESSGAVSSSMQRVAHSSTAKGTVT